MTININVNDVKPLGGPATHNSYVRNVYLNVEVNMNDLGNDDYLANNNARRPRTYRLRESPLRDESFTDEEIRARFRFRRDSILYIMDIVYEDLVRPTNRNHALSVETQVLAALRFFACGSFLQVIGDVVGIDKSTMSRLVTGFCATLNRRVNEFIKFPFDDGEKRVDRAIVIHRWPAVASNP